MAVLDNKTQTAIDELVDQAYEKFEEGNKKESFRLLKEAWGLYPAPKENWNEAYNTAKYIFLDYMKVKQYDDAKEWLNNMIAVNNNLQLNDEDCLFSIGKYKFDTGETKEALEKFQIVVKSAGLRYFEDENPDILNFIKTPQNKMTNDRAF